jgi:L-alanine-DL-glutamate epimerase-like enolase superfamily enzyme
MKITRIDVYGYRLTYAHGEYAMSGGRVADTQESTVVRVTTDEGIEGWGETCPLGGTYLPAFAGGARAGLALLAPVIVGLDPRELAAVHRAMKSVLRGSPEAKSAIDIACWDILAKAAGLPLAILLGGRLQKDFPLYEAVPLTSPEAMAEFVRARRTAGIGAFQVKVGNDPHEDAARVGQVLAVAEDCLVIADANGGWSLQDALIGIGAMADLPIYLEQPCRTLEDCAALRPLTGLPLVLDECVLGPEDLIRAKRIAGAGSANLKLARLGGLTAARLMRDLATDLRMSVSIEDTWGGDITTAAVAHLAASTPGDSLLSVSFFNDWTTEHVAISYPRSANGRGSAPTAPGLGIEVDADSLGEALFHT